MHSHRLVLLFVLSLLPPPRSPLFPYTTLFRSSARRLWACTRTTPFQAVSSLPSTRTSVRSSRASAFAREDRTDRKSTRLNSSHVSISYAVFCLKKKKAIYQRMVEWFLLPRVAS